MSVDNVEHKSNWQDDATMDVLFSPFRDNRDVNPQSWDSKLSFWKDTIVRHCVETNQAVINTKELPANFIRKGKTPTCLPIVINEMHRSGALKRLSEVQAAAPTGWLAWGFGILVKKPLSWTFGTFVKKPIDALLGDKEETGEDFVVVEVLKLKARQVLEMHYSHVENETTDCVVSYSQLSQQCRSMANISVFRFAKRTKRCVTPPTDCDMKLYRLKNAEKVLKQQIEKLTQDMEKCRDEAKGYLSKGLKNSAKNCLRRKKNMERVREGKETAVENIHHMLTIIQQAESNKMILDAYASGSSAFKQITQRYGLSADMIDDVMANVQEVYDDNEDINQSLAAGLTTADEASTAELEAELSAILAGGEEVQQKMAHPPHQDLIDAMCRMRVVEVEEEEGKDGDGLGTEAQGVLSAQGRPRDDSNSDDSNDGASNEGLLDVSLDLPDVPQFHPGMSPPTEAVRVSPKRPPTQATRTLAESEMF